MCGISGIVSRRSAGDLAQTARAMTGSLDHRGPEDEGVWLDPDAGQGMRVALGRY